jgi:hypothetical protein
MIRTMPNLTGVAAVVIAAFGVVVMSACGDDDSDTEPATVASVPLLVHCPFPDDDKPPNPSNDIRVANVSCHTAAKLWALAPSFGDGKPHRPVYANGKPAVAGDWICQADELAAGGLRVTCEDGDKEMKGLFF